MCHVVVVDGSSIGRYQTEKIKEGDGPIVTGLETFLSDGFIALDKGGIMLTEWLEAVGASNHHKANLQTWVGDLMVVGRIRLGDLGPDRNLTKQLKNLGVRGRDQKYISAAKQFGAYAIVSDDADMFDPKLKSQSPKTRAKALSQRKGCVCDFVRKNLNVNVTPIDQICSVVPRCQT
jgi:hypothetical protein